MHRLVAAEYAALALQAGRRADRARRRPRSTGPETCEIAAVGGVRERPRARRRRRGLPLTGACRHGRPRPRPRRRLSRPLAQDAQQSARRRRARGRSGSPRSSAARDDPELTSAAAIASPALAGLRTAASSCMLACRRSPSSGRATASAPSARCAAAIVTPLRSGGRRGPRPILRASTWPSPTAMTRVRSSRAGSASGTTSAPGRCPTSPTGARRPTCSRCCPTPAASRTSGT